MGNDLTGKSVMRNKMKCQPRARRRILSWLLILAIGFSARLQAQNGGGGGGAVSLPGGPGSQGGLGESFQPAMNTGMGSHSISLSATVGIAGMAPHLALRYEGGSGNGLLGLGWSFGPGSIQRKTDKGIPRYVDGPNGIDDDLDGEIDDPGETDVFIEPAGEDLVPVLVGSTTNYFCRNEGSFTRYRRVGDYWEATAPTGARMVYGQSESARVVDPENPSHVFQWLLEKEIDTHGNTLVYRYERFPGASNANETYLVEVRYGAGPGPWTDFHFVRLYYEDRQDWFEDCRPGFVTRIGKRLARVDMGTQGPVLANHAHGDFNLDGLPDNLNRRYLLGYDANASRSVLTSVTQVGADGVSQFPSTQYRYTQASTERIISSFGNVIDSINEPASTFENASVDLVDLNGDGLPDLLKASMGGGHSVSLNEGRRGPWPGAIQWGSPEEVAPGQDGLAWSVALGNEGVHLADMDGDGLSDLVQVGLNTVSYFRNTPQFGVSAASWSNRTPLAVQEFAPPAPFDDPDVQTADMDFDKRIDIVKSIPVGDGVGYQIWYNLGKGRYSSRQLAQPARGYLFSAAGVQLADFNGDRIPDVVRIRSIGIEVTAGLGYGRFTEQRTASLPDGEFLDDTQVGRARLEDVNGDGLADLVVETAEPGSLWFWLNQGNYQLESKRQITGLPPAIGARKLRWMDMNGNGTVDLVIADDGSIPRIQVVDIGELMGYAPRANLLTEIRNGSGGVVSLEYRSSVDFQLEDGTDALGRYRYPGSFAMPFPVDVVSRERVSDSLGHVEETRYEYHDPYYDPVRKQFRGFARAASTVVGDDACPTLVTRYFYDVGATNEIMKGKLLRSMVTREDGAVFSESESTWKLRVFATGMEGTECRWASPFASVTVVRELGVGVPRRVETEVDFDHYGNQTETRSWGFVDDGNRLAGNDERITHTDFAYNTNAWMLRFPIRGEVRDIRGVALTRQEHFYDDPTFSGTNAGVVILGDETLVREWYDLSRPDGYVMSSRTVFDSYGNPVKTLDPLATAAQPGLGHWREFFHDSRFRQFAVREVQHIGDGHPDLVVSAIFDEGFGVTLSSTDANNFVTRNAYDAFGRLLWEIQPGDSDQFPTVQFKYAQAVPYGTGGLIGWTEAWKLDRVPGSIPGALDQAYYHVERTYFDGLGRTVLQKTEAEPDPETGKARFIAHGAVLFHARGGPKDSLHPYFSDSFDFEDIRAPGWTGRFHLDGSLKTLTLNEAPKMRYQCDALGRPVRVIYPDGSFSETRFEPFVTRSFDPNATNPKSPYFGNHTVSMRDGLGRGLQMDEVCKLTDDGRDLDGFATWTTRFKFRVDGPMLSITDSQGNVKSMEYDAMGRLLAQEDWDKGRIEIVYDAGSNRIERKDAKGQILRYTFDGANRVQTEDLVDENASGFSYGLKPDVTYTYDLPGDAVDQGDGSVATPTSTLGKLVRVRHAQGEDVFSYDSRGRTRWSVRRLLGPLSLQPVSYRTSQEFDPLGRITKLVYPDDDYVLFDYNERTSLKSIAGGPNGFILQSRRYAPSGQEELSVFGNGVRTSYAYDVRSRLVDLKSGAAGPKYIDLMAYHYQFDDASNIRRIDDLRPTALIPAGSPRRNTQMFDYDSLYRLRAVHLSHAAPGTPDTGDGLTQYRYDRIGNLLEQLSSNPGSDLGSLSYGGDLGRFNRVGRSTTIPGPHAVTRLQRGGETKEIQYDASGNMTALGQGVQMTWDYKNRLVKYADPSSRAEYRYDYQGQRTLKTVYNAKDATAPSASTLYVNRCFEVRPDGGIVKYVFDGSRRLAQITGRLNATNRIERMRLVPGWNLKAVGGSGTSLFASAESAAEQGVDALRVWNPETQAFEVLGLASPVKRGAAVWVHAVKESTVSLYGSDAWDAPTLISSGATFLPILGAKPVNVGMMLPAGSRYWIHNASQNRWAIHNVPVTDSGNVKAVVAPGEVLFVSRDAAVELPTTVSAPSIRYYHADHLESQSVITDERGMLVEESTYEPFGQQRTHFVPDQETMPVAYGFGGKERDSESGFHYFEARYLLAGLGRFITVDPTEQADSPQSLNGYSYVGNRPTVFADPSGLVRQGLVKVQRKYRNDVYVTSEEKSQGGHGVVKYSKEELAKRRVVINKQGLLVYKHNGVLVDTGNTRGMLTDHGVRNSQSHDVMIFVQTKSGKLYVAEGYAGTIHHTSFTGGRSVRMAGEIQVLRGRIVGVNNRSGHYMPGGEYLGQFRNWLQSKKAKISSAVFQESNFEHGYRSNARRALFPRGTGNGGQGGGYNNATLPGKYNNATVRGEYNNVEVTSQYGNEEVVNEYANDNTPNEYGNEQVINEYAQIPTVNEYANLPVVNEYANATGND